MRIPPDTPRIPDTPAVEPLAKPAAPPAASQSAEAAEAAPAEAQQPTSSPEEAKARRSADDSLARANFNERVVNDDDPLAGKLLADAGTGPVADAMTREGVDKTSSAYLNGLHGQQRAHQMVKNFEESYPADQRRQLRTARSKIGLSDHDIGTFARYISTMPTEDLVKMSGVIKDSPQWQERMDMYTNLKSNLNRALTNGDQRLFNQTIQQYGGEAGIAMIAADMARRENVVGEWEGVQTRHPLHEQVESASHMMLKQIKAYGEQEGGRNVLMASIPPFFPPPGLLKKGQQVDPVNPSHQGRAGNDPGPKTPQRSGKAGGGEVVEEAVEAAESGTARRTVSAEGAEMAAQKLAQQQAMQQTAMNFEGRFTQKSLAELDKTMYNMAKTAVEGGEMSTTALEMEAGASGLGESGAAKVLKGATKGAEVIAIALLVNQVVNMHYDKGSATNPFNS